MNNNLKVSLAIIISGIAIFLLSCTPLSCFEETESFLKASFYDNSTKKMRSPDSLTIYGLNMETNKLYEKAKNIQPALLPLNPSETTCTFIMVINGIRDTITFSYNSYPHLISKECGYTFYHNLETDPLTTLNAIKYVYKSKGNITTLNEENIRIYY